MSLPLDVALRQCERHVSIMKDAMHEMPALLSTELLIQPTPGLTRVLDQFVLRFTKLQDTMGTHVLRQFAAQVLAEQVEDVAFIEVLGLLERHGYLTVRDWALQRVTRNALTHEYPEDAERQALALSAARECAYQLIEWLTKIQERTNAQNPEIFP
jgi:hypothetical protein